MTIFPFDPPKSGWKLRSAQAGALLGALLFFTCWGIGFYSEYRVLHEPAFTAPGADHAFRIEMKGEAFFVPEKVGRPYKVASALIFPAWFLFVGCGLYLNGGRMGSGR